MLNNRKNTCLAKSLSLSLDKDSGYAWHVLLSPFTTFSKVKLCPYLIHLGGACCPKSCPLTKERHDPSNIPHHVLREPLHVNPAHSIFTDTEVFTSRLLWVRVEMRPRAKARVARASARGARARLGAV